MTVISNFWLKYKNELEIIFDGLERKTFFYFHK